MSKFNFHASGLIKVVLIVILLVSFSTGYSQVTKKNDVQFIIPKDFTRTSSGLCYKLYKISKDTIKASYGDWVTLNMRYKYKDSTLFNSVAAMASPIRFPLPASEYKGDIYEGLRLLSAGDSAVFIFSSDSLFTKTFRQPKRPAFIDSNSAIHFYITMLSIDTPASMKKNEEEALKKYIEEKKITVAPFASGLYYIETIKGQGAKIDTGTWVKTNFKVSLINGKQIFSTEERGEPIEFQFGKSSDTPGFKEGVAKMAKGGKATFIVPSKIAFGEKGSGALVPPYSSIIYDVEVVDVLTQAEHESQLAEKAKSESLKLEINKKQEKDLMKKYLDDNKITASPSASGLIYVEKEKGTGAKALSGKKVKVHYTGTLLNGTKFDSSRDRNEPFEFTLGQGQVIKGWDEGIAMMNVGGKATLIIPSNIAYGERDMGQIPPYSTLVFDVELLDVK